MTTVCSNAKCFNQAEVTGKGPPFCAECKKSPPA